MRRLCACLVTGMAIAAGTWLARPSAVAQPPAAAPATASGFELRGAGSCAAAGCHNANGPKGARGSEYTTWVLHDPHARAFEVLYGDRSRLIEKNRHPDAKVPHPERDALCLNCHVLPGIEPVAAGAKKPARSDVFSYEDGVSCEACHGAAGDWLTRHYTASWRARSAADKAADGMRNTKDLLVRAEVCVRCHVGEGDLDVNHDLIAAGHPRLNFEYAAFHEHLPKHWDATGEKKGVPDFGARLWLIGQVASARASLRLLHDRASDGKKPWPEFAESDCFACHHDLADQKWRRARRSAGGRRGWPGWGTWYFALDDVVKRYPPRDGLTYPEAAIERLRRLMAVPDPNRKDVQDSAGQAADALKEWLPALGEKTFALRPRELAQSLELKVRNDLGSHGWDEATQLYLALRAQRPAARRDLLDRLRKALEYPEGYDSPRGFDPPALRKRLDGR